MNAPWIGENLEQLSFRDFVNVANGDGRKFQIFYWIAIRIDGHEDGRHVPLVPHLPAKVARKGDSGEEDDDPQNSDVVLLVSSLLLIKM